MADHSHNYPRSMNQGWVEINRSVLFVCRANQFRSPLAAAFFQELLIKNKMEQVWSVASAGTWTKDGLAFIPSPAWAMDHFSLDLSNHASKAINPKLVAKNDLVIVMERDQKEALQIEYPEMRSKILLLTEFLDSHPYDIPDPTITQEESYFKVANEIKALITVNFQEICRWTILLQFNNQKPEG